MKHSHYLSLLLASGLIFAGCNSSSDEQEAASTQENIATQEDTTTQENTTTITGKTTLSKGFVCVDANEDATCSDDEGRVQTEDDGAYSLTYDGVLADGMQLVAEDGLNLVLEENNLNRLAFTARYYSEDSEHNINTMTTLISNRIANGSSYGDAKAGLASKYNIDESIITADPISLIEDEDGKILFLTIHGMEKGYTQNLKDAQNTSKQRASEDTNSTNSVITEEEADSALDSITDYLSFNLNQYTYKLEQYFLDLKNYALNYILDFKDDLFDGCYFDDNCTEEVNMPREALNGVWYMTKYHACMEIDPQDNLLLRTRDKNESYTIYYREYNSDFTLLSGWVEKGLIQITKDDLFHSEDNNFRRLNISYDEGIEGLTDDGNSSAEKLQLYKSDYFFPTMDKCFNVLG